MSYTQLIWFRGGKAEEGPAFSNAWGGFARIWDALWNTHRRDLSRAADPWILDGTDRLWSITSDEAVPAAHRAVMLFTCDFATVRREGFGWLVDDLRAFVRDYPPGDRVCHLGAWADAIESAPSDVEAVGLYGSSVSNDHWFPFDEERDECVPVELDDPRVWGVYQQDDDIPPSQ